MNILEFFEIIKGILHTFVRVIPLGLYFFTYFASTLYGDTRAGVLLLGILLNDIIGYIFKKYSKMVFNDSCAIFGSYENQNLNFLPNHHTEVVAFIFAFFSFDMYRKGMNWLRFSFLFFMLLVTAWSRMSINCEGDFNTVIFNLIFGVTVGSLYYYFMSNVYDNLKENKPILENKACDKKNGNYTCETIKNGNVIVKEPLKKPEEDDDDF